MRTVTLEPISHTYSDDLGRKYMSATKFLGSFKEPFDSGLIAPLVAKAIKKKLELESKKRRVSIKVVQSEQPLYERGITTRDVLDEWDAKRDAANAKGTYIHDNLENMLLTGVAPKKDEYYDTYKAVWKFIKEEQYAKLFPEVILHSERIMIAGMADLRCQRTTSKNSIIDYYDYKTNVIHFDSSKEKDGKKTQTNKFMNYPLDYMEDTSYNGYALQLSLYAYMDQMMFNTKIGKLAILNVVDGFKPLYVPYMKQEIEMLFRYTEMNKV